jgi:Protein of unknown function (DUF3995)
VTEIALTVCLALVIIGTVHFYWALGGSVGKAGALPHKGGEPVMSPRPASTAIVGFALFAMAAVVGATAGLLPLFLPIGLLRFASAGLAVIFAARAIGEFRYVGFFKKVRGTVFAERDTYIYSPMCLLFAVLVAIIAAA